MALELTEAGTGNPATPQEAAAIAAAVQRFQGDTAIAAPPQETGLNPWLRAALVEGVTAKQDFGPRDPREIF